MDASKRIVRVDNELWIGELDSSEADAGSVYGTFDRRAIRFANEGVIKLEANLANPAARHYKARRL